MFDLARQAIVAVAIAGLACPVTLPAQQPNAGYTFKAQSELVLVNVSVRDKSGNSVRDLKPEDFTVLEDNKPQKVATFDIENTENPPQLALDQVNLLSTPARSSTKALSPNSPERLTLQVRLPVSSGRSSSARNGRSLLDSGHSVSAT